MKLELDRALPPAMLDVEQLKRVFVNLIDNALAAMVSENGENQITIVTRHDAEKSVLRAEVIDTGHGIDSADFRRLFEPYFSRRDSGTGLGLAIVQRIILEHGGHIRAVKNDPRGARFVIELPAEPPRKPEPPAKKEPDKPKEAVAEPAPILAEPVLPRAPDDPGPEPAESEEARGRFRLF